MLTVGADKYAKRGRNNMIYLHKYCVNCDKRLKISREVRKHAGHYVTDGKKEHQNQWGPIMKIKKGKYVEGSKAEGV